MRYSSIVEIDNIQSHPQRFLKGIIINNCNYSRLEKVKKRWETEVEKIKIFLANQNINCAKIDDYYYGDDNSINIVYEYIEGKQLTEESWNEAKIIDFLKNILPTLQKLHDNKIVHGNIKPSNFLEQNYNYFLLDFGFVTKISELIFDEEDHIENEPLQGTEGYRAKEVKEGFEAQPYSDIYSLGISIIELLTGKSPQKFKNQDDEIIWELLKEISPNFLAILKKMVESDYRDRYNNAEEVLDDLREIEKRNWGKNTINIRFLKNFFLRHKIIVSSTCIALVLMAYFLLHVLPNKKAKDEAENIKAKVEKEEADGKAPPEIYEKALTDWRDKVKKYLKKSKILNYEGYLLGQLNRQQEKFDVCQEATKLDDKIFFIPEEKNYSDSFNCMGNAKFELAKGEQRKSNPDYLKIEKSFKESIDFFNQAIESIKRSPSDYNYTNDLLLQYIVNKADVINYLAVHYLSYKKQINENEDEIKEFIEQDIKKVNDELNFVKDLDISKNKEHIKKEAQELQQKIEKHRMELILSLKK